ncbi:MAG TPA: hypothetical protein VM433_03650 [Mycobacteriales bacterium]|nr:hypothetical protein [Mycobacteriales bacterium]
MRRRLLPLALLSVGVLAAPAAAVPTAVPLPTPGFASDNVEWLGNVPLHADTAGAHLRDGYMYVTSSSQLSIYDIRIPESPQLVSTVLSPQEPYFAEEDVDTNGEILLITALDELRVYDITDKTEPVQIGSLDGVDPHTITCVLECAYAWGAEGQVFDLTDPTAPRQVAGLNWNSAQGEWKRPGQTHDVTEVAPGLVMTSTGVITLFDLRDDPLAPRIIAQGAPGDKRFMHANLWPREAQDRWLLVGGETFATDCSDPKGGAFMTWDTTGWQESGTFTMADEYRPAANGVQNGDALTQTYCSHWFTPRPGWEDGGQLAVGWYEHGTRFLEVDEEGQIEEIGFFTPVGTTSSAAYWASDEILYVLDYTRGLDVLRFHDEPVESPLPLRSGRFAGGLAPDAAPARKPLLTPAMIGESWRC